MRQTHIHGAHAQYTGILDIKLGALHSSFKINSSSKRLLNSEDEIKQVQ